MAITKVDGRQNAVVARVSLTYAELGAAATGPDTLEAIDIPVGSTVIGGYTQVVTPFNHGTSAVIDIGDGGDPNRYTASGTTDLTAAAGTRVALDFSTAVPTKYTTQDTIDVVYTAVGTTATAGAVDLVVEYIMDDRATETVD
jgi:hypothetical protein